MLSIASQTLLIRTFISTYSGNEFVMGFCFSSWFLGVALGGFLMGRVSDRIEKKEAAFKISLVLLGFLSILSVAFAVSSKRFFGLLPYEIAPISHTILASFISTFSPSFLFGFAFALSVSYLRTEDAIRSVYFFESAGAFLGGGILSAGIIPFLSHFSGGLLILSISTFTISFLTKKLLWRCLSYVFSILLIIPVFFDKELGSLSQYMKFGILPSDYRSTTLGEYVGFEKDGTNYILANSIPIITYPERKLVEMNTYLPLLLSPPDSDVLFIGGSTSGEGNLLPENARASFVIYPRDVVEMEKKFFRTKRKLKIVSKDPLAFLRGNVDKYGVIAVLHTDPSSAQENRTFTEEFFQIAKRRIKNGGSLVVFAGEPSNYISREQSDYLACLIRTLRSSFPYVELLPSTRFAFIASESIIDVNALIEKINIFNARYAREEYLLWDASRERRDYYISEIERAVPYVKVNSVKRPSLYFYYMRFLAGKEGMKSQSFLRTIEEIKMWHIFLFFLLLTGISFKKKILGLNPISLFGAFIVGFCGLLSEINLAILYQSLFGYLYLTVGLFISAFMGGLTLGTMGKGKERKGFILSLSSLFLFSILCWWASSQKYFLQISTFYGTSVFFVLNFLYGFLMGRIFRESASMIKLPSGKAGGIMDGMDHIGGTLSAFFSSLLFIPVFGCAECFLLVTVLSGCGILAVILSTYLSH